MGRSSKTGGETGSVTASTASLNRRLATSSAPRMLTASEIALLRKSMREIAARIEEQWGHREGDETSPSAE
jgi:hypothetical protein